MSRSIVYGARRFQLTAEAGAADGLLERIAKYIPGEVLSLFMPTMLLAQASTLFSWVLVVAGIVATPLLLYATRSKERPFRPWLWILAPIAFVIWAVNVSAPAAALVNVDANVAAVILTLAIWFLPTIDLILDQRASGSSAESWRVTGGGPHSPYAHGFLKWTFDTPPQATSAQGALSDYSWTTAKKQNKPQPNKPLKTPGIKINSVDQMDDSDLPPIGGKREGGRTLLIDWESNPEPQASQRAHDTLMKLADEVQAISGASKLPELFCCVSDM